MITITKVYYQYLRTLLIGTYKKEILELDINEGVLI